MISVSVNHIFGLDFHPNDCVFASSTHTRNHTNENRRQRRKKTSRQPKTGEKSGRICSEPNLVLIRLYPSFYFKELFLVDCAMLLREVVIVLISTACVTLLPLLSSSFSFQENSSFACSRNPTRKINKTKMGASLFKAEKEESMTIATDKSKEQPLPKKLQHKEEWIKVSEKFTKDVLDPSFLHLPIRGSTVNASSLYPSDFPDHPGLMPGSHKHLGGAYDKTDGCIYGVPANSKSILCIYPDADDNEKYKLKTIPLPERIQDRQMKWLRGILAHGYLWAIPAWADSVLCVDVDAFWGRRELPEGQTDCVQLLKLPENHPKQMRWQWHGAGINHEQTAIFCIPSNAKQVLKVDIATKTTSFIDIEYDQSKYPDFTLDCSNKWYGGIVGDDNAVYGKRCMIF